MLRPSANRVCPLQNCLAGFKRCGTACYDPNFYGCQSGELVQPDALGNIVSDGSQIEPCGTQSEVRLLRLLNAPPSVDVTCTDTLWTNCVQAYDAKTYWCLNGQVSASPGPRLRRWLVEMFILHGWVRESDASS